MTVFFWRQRFRPPTLFGKVLMAGASIWPVQQFPLGNAKYHPRTVNLTTMPDNQRAVGCAVNVFARRGFKWVI
jgi:hypothetical protein